MYFNTLDQYRRRRKVKDDHIHFAHCLNVLHSFQSYVCKQNLVSSTAHTVRTVHAVRTVHTRKVGLAGFDTRRWLCEDTLHTHSHDHKDTVSNPSDLVTKSYIVDSFTNVGICLGQHH